MAEYNPFEIVDPTAGRGRRIPGRTPYVPQPLDNSTVDTGIPPSAPTGGINPGGMYSNTSTNPNQTNIPLQPQYSQYAMPGWDQTKWTDPSHTTIKYQAGRIFSQFDPNAIRRDPTPLLSALRAAGLNPTMVGDDKIDFGDGYGPIDVITSAGTWAWQPTTGGQTSAPVSAPVSAAPAQVYASSGGYDGGGAFGEQIRQKILALMNQSPTNIQTDPVYRGALDAYKVEQQRNAEMERNAIAERMAANGTLDTGGFDTRVLGAEQARGENVANFAGQLGIRELERQRNEIIQALQLGSNLMTEEQRLALTERLGLIDANLRQQSITNQNNQFNQNLGWDMSQFGWLQNLIPYMVG